MAEELKTAAQELVKALDEAKAALEKYFNAAVAAGIESGDASARGLDGGQVRRRINAEVVARLSGPKTMRSAPKPVLQLTGAPEARRFVAARPLAGLT